MNEEPPRLDFSVIKGRLENLLRGLERSLRQDRSANSDDYSRLILRFTVLLNENTYRTITYLCRDDYENGGGKLEYTLTVPALTRTILDAVYNIVFLFEDLEKRAKLFLKAGYRPIKTELNEWKENFKDNPDIECYTI